jgi:hypothetical protein
MNTRAITLLASGYSTREEEYNGRKHIVVPVVALLEGVVHAMNAKNAEFVPGDELRAAGWNGRPLFLGHPLQNGKPISGNSPTLLEEKSIGIVFNAAVKGKKLTMEAWIDIDKATEVAPELLERVRVDDPIEISVGVFTETDDTTGEYNGKKFTGAWHDIVPDHLALLPEGTEGACSREMGCGVRAATKESVMPVEKKDPKNASVLSKVLAMFRTAQPASEMSDNDVRGKLLAVVREIEPQATYVEAVYDDLFVYCVYVPEVSMGWPTNCYTLFQRTYTVAENGAVTIGADKVEVEPVLYYEPVLMNEEPTIAAGKRHSAKDQGMVQAMHDQAIALGANCEPMKNAASGAPRSVTEPAPQTETEMKKCELAKFLETATEEQIKALSDAAEGKTPEVKVVEPKVAEAVVVPATPKPVTFDEVLATASADVQDSINEGLRVGREKKASTIAALKATGRCDMTDEQLNAQTQGQLDTLVKLAGSNVRAAIDFGGAGAPKVGDEKQEVPAAPDMLGAIRAANQAKK